MAGKAIDSIFLSIFEYIVVELTNTVFVNSTNVSTNIETAMLSRREYPLDRYDYD